MQIPRSMHKQSCFYDKLFISGGSTVCEGEELEIATSKCEIIKFDEEWKVIHCPVVDM